MNLIRQRDELKTIMSKVLKLPKNYLYEALNSPAFEVDAMMFEEDKTTPEERQFFEENVLTKGTDVPAVSPFQTFRYYTKHFFDQWFHYKGVWWGVRCNYPNPEFGNKKQWIVVQFSETPGGKNQMYLWNDEKNVTPAVQSGDRDRFEKVMWSINNTLCKFLMHVMSPASTVLKTEPVAPGKSVEWRLARTHYLILHKNHAAKCRDARRAPTHGEIVRGAHWRIAHFRRLVSDRFKNKKGSLVPVREAWVGPREWVGIDNKIYKVVDVKLPERTE